MSNAVLSLTSPPQLCTLGDLFAVYAREYLPSKSSKTQYQQGLQLQRMTQEFGHLALEHVTPAWLRQWRDELLIRYQPGTVRGYIQVLSGVLRVAVDDYEVLEENPLHRVKKPSPPKTRVRYLDDAERERLLAACQQSRNPALYTIVLLALATGARKMELLSLRWSEVDVERRVIQLPETKSGQGRVVPIPPLVVAELQRWGETRRHNVPLVFPGFTGLKPMHISTAWEWARKRANITHFRFHDLRHTAASYLAMSGASVREIAELLGHTTLAMAMVYIHLSTSHLAAVVDRMSSKFLDASSPVPLEMEARHDD